MGTIVTFYSYKGGVGRTMALANVAVLLAQWQKKVLVVDWDLEAPGMEHFFFNARKLSSIQSRPGLIDVLTTAAEQKTKDVASTCQEMLTTVRTPGGGVFQLLTAGARSDGYFRHVRELDVKSFYENQDGGYIVESLRTSWKEHFDYVLIDSRTGITDIGGICTIQLPDILSLVFTATEQSLAGAVDVALKASVERQKLPFDRSQVPALPLPSRFDTQTEHDIAKQWLGRFETTLDPLYKPWLPKEVDRRRFLEVTKIPYTPYFSFGEKLPVIEQGTTDPSGLGFAYETIAALVANNLQQPELVLENRDEFIRLARTPTPLAQTLARPLTESSVLYVNLVSLSRLRPSTNERGPEAEGDPFIRFHKLVADAATKHTGSIAVTSGDGVLLAFAGTVDALLCALSIQEQLAVSTPIMTSFGRLRARMGLYVGHDDYPQDSDSIISIAAAISNKAHEGEIVASKRVRDSVSPIINLEFTALKEQMEFMSDDAIFEEELFEVVALLSVELTQQERTALFEQAPDTKSGGGFQAFLVGLQERIEPQTNRLVLTINDRERIARYAHDYRGGGWQARLRKIFGRTLGPNLGRSQETPSQ